MTQSLRSLTSVWAYYALACAITWGASLPTVLAWMRRDAPSPGALALAGLSALGPLIAAFIFGRREGDLKGVFGQWKTPLLWLALALLVPSVLRVLAAAVSFAVGERSTQWFYPPDTAERLLALFFFPLGEEFGWRGFAYPRLEQRWGKVRASLLLGAMWGFWHLTYGVTPEAAGFDIFVFAQGMIELPLYSLILTYLFEKGGRSMAIALLFHAAAHLNHIELAPRSELTYHVVHVLVVAVAAYWSAKALARREAEQVQPAAG